MNQKFKISHDLTKLRVIRDGRTTYQKFKCSVLKKIPMYFFDTDLIFLSIFTYFLLFLILELVGTIVTMVFGKLSAIICPEKMWYVIAK